MLKRKYTAKDLDIHIYGNGRNKKFIMYTDYVCDKEIGPRWHTKVYPDIEGNKAKATKQALRWLNDPEAMKKYDLGISTNPTKISLIYNGPTSWIETDEKGILL